MIFNKYICNMALKIYIFDSKLNLKPVKQQQQQMNSLLTAPPSFKIYRKIMYKLEFTSLNVF